MSHFLIKSAWLYSSDFIINMFCHCIVQRRCVEEIQKAINGIERQCGRRAIHRQRAMH